MQEERFKRIEDGIERVVEHLLKIESAVDRLTEETAFARSLQRDGAATGRFIAAMKKPVVVSVLTVSGFWALIHKIVYGVWPIWYTNLLDLLK